jgi:hypothetical protein
MRRQVPKTGECRVACLWFSMTASPLILFNAGQMLSMFFALSLPRANLGEQFLFRGIAFKVRQ